MRPTIIPSQLPALLAVLLLGGCSVRNPWKYNTPPTAVAPTGLHTLDPYSRVVVVGRFLSPPRKNISWSDIGQGMSEALSQAMLNQGSFDVWSNERLAESVREILEGPTADRAELLGELHEQHDNVRFVIVGKVTDFHHTADVPRDLRRSTLFGSRCEAIAAIQFTMVDLEAQRVLVADHVFGTAATGRRSAREMYEDVAFGSYLFWNAPLGRATEAAIDKAMERISAVVPTTVKPMRIVRELSDRKVEVIGYSTADVRKGQQFYVCVHDEAADEYHVVIDPLTQLPLRAQVLQPGREPAIAWLMGQKPRGLDLRGAELRWDVPETEDPMPFYDAGEPPPHPGGREPLQP